MKQNGIFNAGAAASLVNSVMDWTEGDIIEHDGHFFSFFCADGRRPDKRVALKAMVDYWQKEDSTGQDRINDSGFFLMNRDTVNARTLERLKISNKDDDDPVVGVVAADARMMAAQFNSAKRILKRLGICNDDLPCRLKVEAQEADFVVVKTSRAESVGTKIAIKLGIKAPTNGIVEGGIETESGTDLVKTFEQSSAWQLDHGAMKSALLMNRIAAGAGVRDLAELEELETQRDIYLNSFVQGRHQDLIIDKVTNALDGLQRNRSALMQEIELLFEQNKRFMKQFWSGKSNDPEFADRLFSMELAFDNAIDQCREPKITKASFSVMKNMEGMGRRLIPDSWFERVGEFGAHALLMVACLDDAIERQTLALELMQAECVQSKQIEVRQHVM